MGSIIVLSSFWDILVHVITLFISIIIPNNWQRSTEESTQHLHIDDIWTNGRDATAPDTTLHDDTLIIIFNCHLVDGINQPNSVNQMSLLIPARFQYDLCMWIIINIKATKVLTELDMTSAAQQNGKKACYVKHCKSA